MKKMTLICLVFFSVFQLFGREVNNLSDLNGDFASVTKIDLSNKGLTEFPHQILQCNNLIELNLSNNGIKNIPLELASLQYLKALNLSTNQGINSAELELLFSKATFSLTSLNLSNCDLLKMPESLGNQILIKSLDISYNNLKTLPYSYTEFSKLQNVGLANNYFTNLNWLIKFWWNIKAVDLKGNKSYNSNGLLMELNFFEKVSKVQLENLQSFTGVRTLPVNDFYFKNCYISEFSIDEANNYVKRMKFSNCQFDKDNYSKNSALLQHYDYLCFEFIDEKYLSKLNLISADTVSFRNCSMTKEMFEDLDESIKYLDLRTIKFTQNDLKYIKKFNPNVRVLTKENLPKNYEISPPFENVTIPSQSKKMDARFDTVFIYDNVALQIPNNAFGTEDGNSYSGLVNMQVKEYLTPESILISGIPMTIESGDENFIFSSGGMIDVRAFDDNDNPLVLKKKIDVTINSSSENTDMNLYFLNEKGVWEEKGKDIVIEPFVLDQSKLDSIAGQNFKDMVYQNVVYVTSRIVPQVVELKKANSFKLKFNLLPTTDRLEKNDGFIYIPHDIPDVKFLSKAKLMYYGDSSKYYIHKMEEIQKHCAEAYEQLWLDNTKDYNFWGPEFVQNVELIPDLEKDVFLLKFNFKDELIEMPMILAQNGRNINSALKLNKKFFQKYKTALRRRDQSIKKGYMKVSHYIINLEKTLKRTQLEREKTRQKLIYEKDIARNGPANPGSVVRMFEIDNFGIFNCDIKSRMKKPINIGYKFYGKDKITQKPRNIVVLDYDANGVVQFENANNAFFDKESKSLIIVFFSNLLAGVYMSWKHNFSTQGMQLKEFNPKKMNSEELYQLIQN